MSLSLKLRPTRQISRKWRRSSPISWGSKSLPSWEDIRAATIAKLDLREMLAGILGSVTSVASGIFLVVVYAFFLGAERRSLADKLAAAFPRGDQERTARLIHDINSRIGDYLAIRTLINVILGVVSYLIMLFMGLDFAVFWAVLIALGNYIPYVGSLAVLFPIVFSIAQFGSLATTLILAALLTLAQIVSDNILEPKMFAKQLNLSPFVIVVALSLWSALWGLPARFSLSRSPRCSLSFSLRSRRRASSPCSWPSGSTRTRARLDPRLHFRLRLVQPRLGLVLRHLELWGRP